MSQIANHFFLRTFLYKNYFIHYVMKEELQPWFHCKNFQKRALSETCPHFLLRHVTMVRLPVQAGSYVLFRAHLIRTSETAHSCTHY